MMVGGGDLGYTLLVVIVDVFLVVFIMASPVRVLESTTSALSHGLFLERIFTIQSHSHCQIRHASEESYTCYSLLKRTSSCLFLETHYALA